LLYVELTEIRRLVIIAMDFAIFAYTPPMLALGILAIAQFCRDGNNALIHIVGQRHKHMDGARRTLRQQRDTHDRAQQKCQQ
jgi:hypothetical protein